ncbi:MAG: hypothetical protein ACRCWO_00955 [Bosea sp. (in: a-proteobacteria)]
MFAAMIRTGPDVMPLAATLSVLVEGAAAGLIGHAVIIAPAQAGEGEIGRLADATGADLIASSADIASDWRKAAMVARGDWLVLMQAGEMPGQNWVQALERHALTAQGKPGFMPRAGWRGTLDRWMPPSRAGAGYVLAKPQLLAGTSPRPRIVGTVRER